jgi:hypothetical protein
VVSNERFPTYSFLLIWSYGLAAKKEKQIAIAAHAAQRSSGSPREGRLRLEEMQLSKPPTDYWEPGATRLTSLGGESVLGRKTNQEGKAK